MTSIFKFFSRDDVLVDSYTLHSSINDVKYGSVNNFKLEQNYPNPFNPQTSIKYTVSNRQFVSLKVFDSIGKDVSTLVDEEKPSGIYKVVFSAKNLPSGIYFYTIRAGDFTQTKKMVILK